MVVGIETDRGPWVQALLAAGYTVYAINPLQVGRYRERHGVSGAKSDPGDAHVLAELVRLDRDHHRPIAGDSAIAEHVKVLARAHQSMIWSRQRQTNTLRSMLREYYPAALAAFGATWPAGTRWRCWRSPRPRSRAPAARAQVERRCGGPGGNATSPPAPRHRGRAARRAAGGPSRCGEAYAASAKALVAVITELARQSDVLEGEVEAGFGRHPDAEIYLSQPGLGQILGARVLAEFGDDPHRYADARARKNYSGMAPVTRASGKARVVLARHARNRRLADALYQQAFAALSASPGARAYYDAHRARGNTHHQALRALANRLVGILHGCLRHHTPYNETTAWPPHRRAAA